MADHDSHLPVRSEKDGDDERVHVKLVGNDEGNSGDGQAADNQQKISDDSFASVETDGVYDPTAGPGLTNTDPSNTGLVGLVRNTAPDDTHQTLRISAKTGTVAAADPTEPQTDDQRSLDVSLHDEAGNAYTSKNPMPVSMEESEGDEIHDPHVEVDLAKGASVTFNYDTAGLTERFNLFEVHITASGKIKTEIFQGQGEVAETFVSKDVNFNSTAVPDAGSFKYPKVPLRVVGGANGTSFQVTITNRDQQPMDVYATFIGIKYS